MSAPRLDAKKFVSNKDLVKEFEEKMFDLYCPALDATYKGFKKELFTKYRATYDEIKKLEKNKKENYLLIQELKLRLIGISNPTSFEEYTKDDYIGIDGQVRATGMQKLSGSDATLKQTLPSDFMALNKDDQAIALRNIIKNLQASNKEEKISGTTINATISWTTITKNRRYLHIRNLNLGCNTYLVTYDEKGVVKEKCLRISEPHYLPPTQSLKADGHKCLVNHALGLTAFEKSGLKHDATLTFKDIELEEGETAVIIETSNSMFEEMRFHPKQMAIDTPEQEVKEISTHVFAHQESSLIELGYHLFSYAFCGNGKRLGSLNNIAIVPLQITEQQADNNPQLTLIAEGQGPEGARISQNTASSFIPLLEKEIYKKLPLQHQVKKLKAICDENLTDTMQHISRKIKKSGKDNEAKFASILKVLESLSPRNEKSINQFKKSNPESSLQKYQEFELSLEKNMRAKLNKITSRLDCTEKLKFLFKKYILINQMKNCLSLHSSPADKIGRFKKVYDSLVNLEAIERRRKRGCISGLFCCSTALDPFITEVASALDRLPNNHEPRESKKTLGK